MSGNLLTPLKIVSRAPQNSLPKALDLFLLDCRSRRLAPKTVTFYETQLKPALGFFESTGITELAQVDPYTLRAYLVALQDRELKDNSIHAAARSLRVFFNFLVREELLAVSPMNKVRMPVRDKKVLPAFSLDEVNSLLEAVTGSVRDTAIVLCLLDSGLRAAEFVALDIADIDSQTGAVKVRLGKGRKSRTSFLGNRAQKAVKKWLLARPEARQTEPLWTSSTTGERLTQDGLRQLLQRIAARSEVPNCHPHTFRRTFALWSLRAGMDLQRLAGLLGHADLSVLRQYLALVETDLQEAHSLFGPVDSFTPEKRSKTR